MAKKIAEMNRTIRRRITWFAFKLFIVIYVVFIHS